MNNSYLDWGITMGSRNFLGGSIFASIALVSTFFIAGQAAASVPNQVTTLTTDDISAYNDCVELGKSGKQVWYDTPGSDVTQLGEALDSVANDNQNQIAGVALCSHYDGAAIFVKSPSDGILKEVAEIAKKFPDQKILTRSVDFSLNDLLATQIKLMQNQELVDNITGIAPDIYNGGLLIDIKPELWAQVSVYQSKIETIVEPLVEPSMSLKFQQGGEGELSSRDVDYAPHWMGAKLNGSAGGYCSSGVPLIIGGVRRLLTAGHCTSGTYSNNGQVVGSTYTTSYPGKAKIFGDWKLLQGSSYALRVYSGDVYSSASLPITGAEWGVKALGSGMCSSGATTGQICRYYVADFYKAHSWNGVLTYPLTMLGHTSSGQPGFSDSNGWKPGDSGGPCYFSDGAGGVKVAGIVTGRYVAGSTDYYCTQLSGVRAWNSSAYVG